jgi:tRNA (guanine37-N1)-methyltransferase
MRIDIVTIFPEMLRGFFEFGVIGQAVQEKILDIRLHDLRDFTLDKHRQVDDRPYGGGPGMLLKPEPLFRAIESITKEQNLTPRVILMSAQGRLFSQNYAKEFSKEASLLFLCGRYEGVDERVLTLVTDELSIGDYVLSGGELPAVVVAETVARLVPGVVGKIESIEHDSFYRENLLGAPQYTRPPEFDGLKVPDVLLTGNHQQIEKWRERAALEKTLKNRPDLLKKS